MMIYEAKTVRPNQNHRCDPQLPGYLPLPLVMTRFGCEPGSSYPPGSIFQCSCGQQYVSVSVKGAWAWKKRRWFRRGGKP